MGEDHSVKSGQLRNRYKSIGHILPMSDPMKNLDAFIARRKCEESNRRQTRRIKAAKQLRIVPNDGSEAIFGVLIDLSKSGARLRPMINKDIPDEFDLELEAGLSVPCKVVYRNDGAIGVKFILHA